MLHSSHSYLLVHITLPPQFEKLDLLLSAILLSLLEELFAPISDWCHSKCLPSKTVDPAPPHSVCVYAVFLHSDSNLISCEVLFATNLCFVNKIVFIHFFEIHTVL